MAPAAAAAAAAALSHHLMHWTYATSDQ